MRICVIVASVVGLLAVGGVSRAEEGDQTGPRPRALTNCPSAVPGSTTRVRNVPGGIEVTVRSSNRFAARQIRTRARASRRPLRAGSELVEHSGRATGGGRIGYCPVVRGYTRLSVKNVPDGATITIRPIDRRDLATLRRTSRERAAALRGVL
jgi:hypothetical protein